MEPYILELSEIPRGFVNAFIAKTACAFGESSAYAALSNAKDCAITVGEYRDDQTVVFLKEENPAK